MWAPNLHLKVFSKLETLTLDGSIFPSAPKCVIILIFNRLHAIIHSNFGVTESRDEKEMPGQSYIQF
ncbi:MAG TPA: hypothetical protein DEF82_04535 [Crocinitomicaceae bacterium]|nr:hypothetical protein [Crocinitomicaceae bacterium]